MSSRISLGFTKGAAAPSRVCANDMCVNLESSTLVQAAVPAVLCAKSTSSMSSPKIRVQWANVPYANLALSDSRVAVIPGGQEGSLTSSSPARGTAANDNPTPVGSVVVCG